MTKRIMALLLCAITLFTVCACEKSFDGTDTQAESDTAADTQAQTSLGKLIVDKNGTGYVMVAPTGSSMLFSACTDAKDEFYKAVGKNVFVKSDGSYKESQYEILVGATNRAESAELSEGLSFEEYRIKWMGDKLVCAGGSDYAARAGLRWLVDTYVKTSKDNAVYIPDDIDKRGTYNVSMSFDKLKAGWNLLSFPAENGVELKYQLYMPKNYDPQKKYPTILYMHSAGVKNDEGSQIYASEAKFLRNIEQSQYKDEVIIISPSCPVGELWVPAKTWKEITYDFVNVAPTKYMTAVTELFGIARANLSCDESRLYLYGMSMGGFATWDLLARNPDLFAAAIPVAGAGDPSVASKLSGTAIWIFHGRLDPTVPCESSDAMYNALLAAGREDVKYTVFEDKQHGIWHATADTEGILDWLFAQKRK